MKTSAAILWFLVLAAPVYAQSDLVFPQIAVGGNPVYETVLHLVNEVDQDNPVTIEVFQGKLAGTANGTPLAVKFDGAAAAAARTVTLSSFQEFSTTITGTSMALMNGWLRVRSTLTGGKITGSLLFRQRTGATVVDSVGSPTPQRFRDGIIQLDHRDSGSGTGIAFVNPDAVPVDVTLDLFQGLKRLATPRVVSLQPNQHYAAMLSEIFPAFQGQQATLVIEVAAGHTIPCLGMRLDGNQYTSIAVRPVGFSFSYTVTTETSGIVETGYWLFDMVGFNLVGTGRIETPAAVDLPEVTGSWSGTNFQFRYRKVFADNSIGMVVFNGTSAGPESTTGTDGKSRAVTGKVTTIGADGRVISVNNFTAYHRFGTGPQIF
jgi:hypothetical protein